MSAALWQTIASGTPLRMILQNLVTFCELQQICYEKVKHFTGGKKLAQILDSHLVESSQYSACYDMVVGHKNETAIGTNT